MFLHANIIYLLLRPGSSYMQAFNPRYFNSHRYSKCNRRSLHFPSPSFPGRQYINTPQPPPLTPLPQRLQMLQTPFVPTIRTLRPLPAPRRITTPIATTWTTRGSHRSHPYRNKLPSGRLGIESARTCDTWYRLQTRTSGGHICSSH